MCIYYNICNILVLGVYKHFYMRGKIHVEILVWKQKCALRLVSLYLIEDNKSLNSREVYFSLPVSPRPLHPVFLFCFPQQLISIFRVTFRPKRLLKLQLFCSSCQQQEGGREEGRHTFPFIIIFLSFVSLINKFIY